MSNEVKEFIKGQIKEGIPEEVLMDSYNEHKVKDDGELYDDDEIMFFLQQAINAYLKTVDKNGKEYRCRMNIKNVPEYADECRYWLIKVINNELYFQGCDNRDILMFGEATNEPNQMFVIDIKDWYEIDDE